jgi:glycine C-acetyltransferase
LDKICDLADKYDAMVMIDECHATGFIGATGKGTLEAGSNGQSRYHTGTLGKALGGAMAVIQPLKKRIRIVTSTFKTICSRIHWHQDCWGFY